MLIPIAGNVHAGMRLSKKRLDGGAMDTHRTIPSLVVVKLGAKRKGCCSYLHNMGILCGFNMMVGYQGY